MQDRASIPGSRFDEPQFIRQAVEDAARACRVRHRDVEAELTTTYAEVVAVTRVDVDGAPEASACIRERLWALEFPPGRDVLSEHVVQLDGESRCAALSRSRPLEGVSPPPDAKRAATRAAVTCLQVQAESGLLEWRLRDLCERKLALLRTEREHHLYVHEQRGRRVG